MPPRIAMPSGYEKSPDYGNPPKRPWVSLAAFVGFFVGVTALLIWWNG